MREGKCRDLGKLVSWLDEHEGAVIQQVFV